MSSGVMIDQNINSTRRSTIFHLGSSFLGTAPDNTIIHPSIHNDLTWSGFHLRLETSRFRGEFRAGPLECRYYLKPHEGKRTAPASFIIILKT